MAEPGKQQGKSSDAPEQRRFMSEVHAEDVTGGKPPTGYFTSLMHLAKCYVGTGIFAMGDGFKNSGLILGPILLAIIGVMNLNCQHILVKTVVKIASQEAQEVKPSFAETVQYTMQMSSINCLKRNSAKLGWMVNIFLCATELGFCCVYFVFIAEHLVEIASDHNWLDHDNPASKHIVLMIILLPMWASTFLGNFKLLLPLSVCANVLMWTGIVIIVYFTTRDGVPSTKGVNMVSSFTLWPLFFGTALYAFEGITFIIPLRNEMKYPDRFVACFGVLNVGMVFVAFLYTVVGVLGYWKYGEEVESSVFLNIPKDVQALKDAINIMMSIAVLFTFTLHMYIPIDITFPLFWRKYGPFKHGILVMFLYRSVPVLVTFTMANIIPFLGLFISLIGASCGAFLALILPPILEMIAFQSELAKWEYAKNIIIIVVGVVGAISGTILSIYDIIQKFRTEYGGHK